ncbi:MAG: phosphodiester glycosidase family protein [Candidatus Marinimicrobia bacterium]|nr:phosphodiester glycosidase family protein [Candidatus Neomarinimicrobiota bacterium]MCF7851028.1 phosphodiester glycosidase family protein [Candidatus Neomarinimicrobiota bacterium]
MGRTILLVISLLFLLIGCNSDPLPDGQYVDLDLQWAEIDTVNAQLPAGIKVFHTASTDLNLRAWYVRVEESRDDVESRVVVSTDADRRETISEFATRLSAPVLINGGYFRMDLNPARHVGILKVNDSLIQPATPSVLRSDERFYLHRGAIGFDEQDRVGIGWVSSQGDSVTIWERPIPNRPDIPGSALDSVFGAFWGFRDVLGGGPVLIKNGRINIASDEEVFFGTSIPDTHPRTAAGITEDGDLILLLVDGRQLISRGVNLTELASILYDLDCVDALNLDGGGSSALVVNGVLLNRPAGTTTQRQVMSAIAVFAN